MTFIEAMDQGFHPWILRLHTPWLDSMMIFITDLGSRKVLAPVVIALTIGFLLRRRYKAALIFPIIAVAGKLLEIGIKSLVRRPRPEALDSLVPLPSSFSYPSGHALNSATIYVTAVLLLSTTFSRPWSKKVLILFGLALIFLIGFSRLYLGVHYLSDVIAGWAAGLALAMVGYGMTTSFTTASRH